MGFKGSRVRIPPSRPLKSFSQSRQFVTFESSRALRDSDPRRPAAPKGAGALLGGASVWVRDGSRYQRQHDTPDRVVDFRSTREKGGTRETNTEVRGTVDPPRRSRRFQP